MAEIDKCHDVAEATHPRHRCKGAAQTSGTGRERIKVSALIKDPNPKKLHICGQSAQSQAHITLTSRWLTGRMRCLERCGETGVSAERQRNYLHHRTREDTAGGPNLHYANLVVLSAV